MFPEYRDLISRLKNENPRFMLMNPLMIFIKIIKLR